MQANEKQTGQRDGLTKPKRTPLFSCRECGKRFYTVRAAERASFNGCRCGGGDIDIHVESETGDAR